MNPRTIFFFNAKVILKNIKYTTNDKILKERENCQFQFPKGLNNLFLRLRKKSTQTILRTNYLHKNKKMSAVTLDVAPERPTERCSPRFRPGDRFWSQRSNN